MDDQSRLALAQAPQAAAWARRFIGSSDISLSRFRRYAAPSTVRCGVQGIAEACVPDPDGLMRQLLVDTIHDCTQACGKTSEQVALPRETVTS
jgi:hypothetical protein